MALRIYLDESVPTAIADGLRRYGVDAWSARDAGNRGWSDEEQLAYASREKAVLFTHDNDFFRLAHRWERHGKEYWGILYAAAKRFSIGECIFRLMDFAVHLDPEEMRNRMDFL